MNDCARRYSSPWRPAAGPLHQARRGSALAGTSAAGVSVRCAAAVLSSAGRHDASGRRQPLSVPPQCQPGAGAGCSAGVSGRQRLAFPEGLCGVFQLVFPADILLFLYLRAGPRGRHFYQPSELSLGDGLPVRRTHPRPRRPLRRELRAPFPVPLHLHPRGGLHHHVLHPALLGGQGQTPSFIAAAHRRGEGQTRRCR